ncbi:MAG: response regulator transcription factor [Verrucomicrobiota bacterium]|jgi:DNA-binding NarL/FixJ family response regulator
MKFLIVDDHAAFRAIVKSMLQAETAEFIECSNGREAIREYAAHRPDWVLMDIEMEEMDGLTATQRIKHQFPQARILILTQYDDPALVTEATMAGAAGFLLKDNLADVKIWIDRASFGG